MHYPSPIRLGLCLSLASCMLETYDGGRVLSDGSADGTTSTDGPSDTTISIDSMDTTDGQSSVADSGTGEASTTGGTGIELVDPCLDFGIEDCPEECMVVRARPQFEDACNTDGAKGLDVCIGRGGTATDVQTTYYAAIDGQVYYLVLGHACSTQFLDWEPNTWFECTGAPEEPELCSCLCGTNGCPFDEEAELLDSCTPPPICGPQVPHSTGDPPSEYDLCTLAALRDRTPGVVETAVYGLSGFIYRAYLDGSNDTQHLYAYASDLCVSPLNGTWDPAQRCTLKPPSYFDTCLLLDDAGVEQCLHGTNWYEDCFPVPAQCP